MERQLARTWPATALEEARAGLAEGDVPIGAALYGADGALLDDPECVATMREFVARRPALWNEDIGE
ncbi:hypothetical protein AB0H30_28455 [Streptomyces pseudogriseolus]|uniref:hypothetical protein n=1 Tax=Streptomyces pseudogriseolus TaxID=36817 RepID=UPI00349A444A